ncbi:hypothetical protein J6590_083788, partial [Homalodisca vitripennis]
MIHNSRADLSALQARAGKSQSCKLNQLLVSKLSRPEERSASRGSSLHLSLCRYRPYIIDRA